jgi:DNA mismatch endonuclease (patch repair protein)
MTDVFSKSKRSDVMSHIRGHGNKDTEIALLNLFHQHHITGWRRNQPVFGKPDFVFYKSRVAVFVDGCFWHGCPKHCNQPANNRSFWLKKFTANKMRDIKVSRTLKESGWNVIRVWEHDLKSAGRVIKWIKKATVVVEKVASSKNVCHGRVPRWCSKRSLA